MLLTSDLCHMTSVFVFIKVKSDGPSIRLIQMSDSEISFHMRGKPVCLSSTAGTAAV